jgi:hypothetical protein
MYEALRAALKYAMAQGSEPEPGVLTINGALGARLRLDDQGITCRNPLGRTHRIGWDQVRWLRDGARNSDMADTGAWMLCIVLHNGRVIKAEATQEAEPARPSKLAAIREEAARHAVPVVLTGAPAKRGRPREAGRYVDPGGKLGLREWTGTEWSPHLWVDPASIGHDAGTSPVRVRSPLPEQQRRWDAAARRARRKGVAFAAWLGATAIAAAAMLGLFIYDLGRPKAGLGWAIVGLLWLGAGAIITFGTWRELKPLRKAAQAAKRAAELARAEDTPASPLDDRGGDPAAGAPVSGQPPAADPAAGAGRISCRECGADSDRATQICARCGAPLLPLSSP